MKKAYVRGIQGAVFGCAIGPVLTGIALAFPGVNIVAVPIIAATAIATFSGSMVGTAVGATAGAIGGAIEDRKENKK